MYAAVICLPFNIYITDRSYEVAKKTINILSYNTHLMGHSIIETGQAIQKAFSPGGEPITKEDDARRKAIMSRIKSANSDIAGLTEVWGHSVMNDFSNVFNQGHYNAFYYSDDPTFSASCGMVIIWQGSFDFYHKKLFQFAHYTNLTGADKMAYKGIYYGKHTIQGIEVGIIQTHTQASYTIKNNSSNLEKAKKMVAACGLTDIEFYLQGGLDPVDQAARDCGLKSTLFKTVLSSEIFKGFTGPMFFLGDLNIVASSKEYDWLSQQMKSHGFADAWVTAKLKTGKGITYDPQHNSLVKYFDRTQTIQQRIDYIFYKPGETIPVICTKAEVPTDWALDDGTPLSDHYPLIGTFEIG